MRFPHIPSVALAAFLLASGTALAGPPFITDDPEPIEPHHWEITFASFDFKTAEGWSGGAPLIDINYGAAPGVQLHILASLGFDAPNSSATHHGPGDLELGTKVRFIDESDYLPQIGVYPMLECATGSAKNGLGNGGTQALIPLWLQKSWGKWTAYGGYGYGINSGAGNRDWSFLGAVIQRKVLDSLTLGFETYHQTAKVVGDSQDTAFNIGVTYDFNEHHHLLFSAGRSFDGPTKFQCYLGYQITFEHGVFGAASPP